MPGHGLLPALPWKSSRAVLNRSRGRGAAGPSSESQLQSVGGADLVGARQVRPFPSAFSSANRSFLREEQPAAFLIKRLGTGSGEPGKDRKEEASPY